MAEAAIDGEELVAKRACSLMTEMLAVVRLSTIVFVLARGRSQRGKVDQYN